MPKQFVLILVFYVLTTHINIMTDILFNFLMNVLPYVYVCSLRKKSGPLLPEARVKCIYLEA